MAIRQLMDDGLAVVIPVVVLTEAITGTPRDAPTNQTVRRHGSVETTEGLARAAGGLRFTAIRNAPDEEPPSGIDAIVAAHAAAADDAVVFTSDPSDLRRLLADHPHIRVESV